MSELTPITRVESYLDAIVNNGIPPTEDITRIETFLQAIYDNQVCALTPITRIEMFLGKISGQDIVLPEPITRIELYLAAIAGEDVELPENPITRIEMYLADWADSGDWATISGAIVEFITQRVHKLKSCVVSLSPKQDLHGYDSPWPEGGGVNKLPPAASYSAVTVNGVTVTPYPDGHYHLEKGAATENNATIRINLAKSVPVSAGMYFAPICATKNANVVIDINDSAYNRTATGFCGKASTEITDAGTGVAEIITLFVVASQSNLSLDIYPLISETALDVFSPFSNICPISGWTGCEVYVTGHNVWDEEWINGYIGAQGQYVYNANYIVSKNYIPVAPSTTYFLQTNGAQWEVYSYRADKSFIKRLVIYGADITFTTEDDCRYIHIVSHNVTQTYGHDVSVNYPSTDHDYHAYNGNSYSVTFPTVNVWDEQTELGLLNPDGSVSEYSTRLVSPFISVVPGASYAFHWPSSTGRGRGAFYDANKNLVQYEADFPPSTSLLDVSIFTVPENAYYLRFNLTTAYGITYNNDISINHPSVFIEYYAYGEPLAVYGGTLDVASGVLTITDYSFDLGSLTWENYQAENHRFSANITSYPPTSSTWQDGICSIYEATGTGPAGLSNGTIKRYNSGNYRYIYICDDRFTDASQIATALSGELFVVKLITPVTIQLTPQQVTALKGYNAMWSDAGDIEVTVHGTPVEVETLQALNMLLGGAYRNSQTQEDVSDNEALDILLGGADR